LDRSGGKAALRALVALLAVAILVAVALFFSRDKPGSANSADVAAWNIPSLTGPERVALADFRGKPVVVNFFASWCDACRFELPGFSKVSEELEGKVIFVGVNSQDGGQGLAMARRYGIDRWHLARDFGPGDSALHDALGGRGMPITVFYDRSGRKIDFANGALSEPALRQRLADLYGV